MQTRLGLVELMRRYGISKRGRMGDLVQMLGLGRQATSKIVNGRTGAVSFDQLGTICEWLLDQLPDGAPEKQELRAILPGALLRFTGPWDAIQEASHVVLHLGERYWRSSEVDRERDPWISGSDSSAATRIVRGLTQHGAHFSLQWRNVPLHVFPDESSIDRASLEKDRTAAKQRLREVLSSTDTASIVIGSQRVNLLTEAFIAHLFSCEPFSPPGIETRVPVYLQYRQSGGITLPDSCFGAPTAPPGCERGVPGCYWRSEPGQPWHSAPFQDGIKDAGIVIVVQDHKNHSTQILLFGYSAVATAELGRFFGAEPLRFWPLRRRTGDRSYGVFVCSGDVSGDGGMNWAVTSV